MQNRDIKLTASFSDNASEKIQKLAKSIAALNKEISNISKKIDESKSSFSSLSASLSAPSTNSDILNGKIAALASAISSLQKSSEMASSSIKSISTEMKALTASMSSKSIDSVSKSHKELEKSATGAGVAIESAGKSANSSRKSILELGTSVYALQTVFNTLKGFIGSFVSKSMEIEQANAVMQRFYMNQGLPLDQAKQKVDEFQDVLIELSMKLNTSYSEVMTLARGYINLGYSLSETRSIIKMSADIAAGTGASFESVNNVLRKVLAGMPVMNREVLQILRQGIPIQKQLIETVEMAVNAHRESGEYVKITNANMFDMLKKRQVSTRDFLVAIGEVSNKYKDAAQDMQSTTAGLKTNIGDAMMKVSKSIMDYALPPIKFIIFGIYSLIEAFSALPAPIRSTIVYASYLAVAITGLATSMAAFSFVASSISGPLSILTGLLSINRLSILAIIGVIGAAIYNFETLSKKFSELSAVAKALVSVFISFAVIGSISALIATLSTMISGLIPIITTLSGVMRGLAAITLATEAPILAISLAIAAIGSAAVLAVVAVDSNFNKIKLSALKLWKSIKETFGGDTTEVTSQINVTQKLVTQESKQPKKTLGGMLKDTAKSISGNLGIDSILDKFNGNDTKFGKGSSSTGKDQTNTVDSEISNAESHFKKLRKINESTVDIEKEKYSKILKTKGLSKEQIERINNDIEESELYFNNKEIQNVEKYISNKRKLNQSSLDDELLHLNSLKGLGGLTIEQSEQIEQKISETKKFWREKRIKETQEYIEMEKALGRMDIDQQRKIYDDLLKDSELSLEEKDGINKSRLKSEQEYADAVSSYLLDADFMTKDTLLKNAIQHESSMKELRKKGLRDADIYAINLMGITNSLVKGQMSASDILNEYVLKGIKSSIVSDLSMKALKEAAESFAAFARLDFIGGFAHGASAAAYTAGATTVANAQIKFADGGFVKKSPGGIIANIGEGNSDELVLPVSNNPGVKAIAKYISEDLKTAGSKSGTIEIVNNITLELDGDAIKKITNRQQIDEKRGRISSGF